jgi:Ser/Thr protein kinase RdoA (MazF antagonist)
LHAANVRVRATDAILIDFFAHQTGPVVYDAACIEASLVVEGFGDGRKLARDAMSYQKLRLLDEEIQEWMEALIGLYDNMDASQMLRHPNPKDPTCWFHKCIRQVRRYAREAEMAKDQYAGALGLALLTKATKDLEVPEPEGSRRAAAYVFAELVLTKAFTA